MKIPKSEKLLLTYVDGDDKYYITRCLDGSGYMGYIEEDGKLKKLGKKRDPLAIEAMFGRKEQSVRKRTKKMDRG